ncbi:MAG TPA: hypothetical protein VLV89_06140 [Candidatus Acidoferrum sp.]|nr:hypothetical protein [Candidatus Acidoferrum sp.]
MDLAYDIYRQLESRKLIWIDRVRELEEAKQRVNMLELRSPGQYLIYDFRNHLIIDPPSSVAAA